MKKRIRMGLAVLCAAAMMCTPAAATQSSAIFGDIGEGQNRLDSYQEEAWYGEVVALDDVGISIVVDDYTAIREDDDGFVYIYTMADGCIPYILMGRYGMQAYNFVDRFTEFMESGHPDLAIASPEETLMLAGKEFRKIVYTYEVSGYTTTDTRLFYGNNGFTYMFASKEIPAKNNVLAAGYLEQIAASFNFLAGGYSDYKLHVNSEESLESKDTLAEMGNTGSDGGFSGGSGSDNTGTDGGEIGSEPAPVGSTVEEIELKTSEAEGSINFRESAANYEGKWVSFSDMFMLYLPADWVSFSLSDEQMDNGILYQAGADSYDSNAPYISVNFGSSQGETSLRAIAQGLAQAGYDVEGIYSINGMDCISYQLNNGQLAGVMFFCPTNPEYVMAVLAVNYIDNSDMLSAVLCSATPG